MAKYYIASATEWVLLIFAIHAKLCLLQYQERLILKNTCLLSENMQKSKIQKCKIGDPQTLYLCIEFRDIFSEYVRKEPARVPPMEIEVDESKWFINKNRLPPRPQTEARQRAIQTQVELYKSLNVIEESNASAHSQVHLVPKPDPNEWRFCLDFVRLNEATVGLENWPARLFIIC